VLTDGQVSATEVIVGRFRAARSRIHCLGIGAASQDRFLTLLSRVTGGVCRFLTPRERVDLGALDLFATVKRPLVSDLQVSFSGLRGAAAVVAAPSAVFEGLPLVIMAKAAEVGPGVLHLAWAGGARTRQVDISLEPSPQAETVRLLQGARLITDADASLNAELGAASQAESREAKRWREKLESLSKEYGLASRAMSLVAVVERAGDDASKVPTTRVLPVGLAQDVAFDQYVGGPQMQLYRVGGIARASHQGWIGKAAVAGMACESEPGIDLRWMQRSRGVVQKCLLEVDSAPPPMEEIEDILVRKFGDIQNGGMDGPSEEIRLLRSLAALLILGLLGHSSHSGPFRVGLAGLVKFARPRLTLIPTEDAREIMGKLIDAADQGRIASGPQERAYAETLAPQLEATRVDWQLTAQEWSKFLP